MESAALDRKRAEEQSENAAVLAGIRQESDSLGTALSAMEGTAQKDRDAAESARLKGQLLTEFTPQVVEDDPNIKAALGEVTGAEAPPTSVSERLAALKKKSQ
jgi:hypothetical protein